VTEISTGIWTADNVWVGVNATVSFAVTDAALLKRTIGHADSMVEEAVVWALRDTVGVLPFERALGIAAELNRVLPGALNARTSVFGVEVTDVAVTSIAQAPEPSLEEDLKFVLEMDFSVVLRGYDRGHVDGLLRRAHDALLANRPDLRAAAVHELGQPIPVRLRGYDRVQVDNLVRLVAAALTGGPPV
jgi:hypothetical protein